MPSSPHASIPATHGSASAPGSRAATSPTRRRDRATSPWRRATKASAAFDVRAVGSVFFYGVATADTFIKSGQYKKALVVGAEVFSRILDWNDRGTCVLFGDGAGAVVLTADSKPGIHASRLHADGSHADLLSVPGNVCGGAVVGSPFLQM